ncbi:hypothetical protein RHMOL_Rhmol06G0309800 [Rhododendron molle]|uniref:Uncharacterized protein n=1 Tax=Rhododendron molle TaxID=49168 RepID=A0ACC0NKF9_RHOML|nr:hypothetical protein RHMOL_Rhmol06G0309800 [Rhododendron molle]
MEKKGSSSLNIALIHLDLGIGTFQVIVYGAFLPRHIFYHLDAVCAYLRCIFVAVCVMFIWPSFDVVLADQVVFYCHFPDLLLAQHTTILRQIYRKPIDFIEDVTTGTSLDPGFVSCMADLILVNSRFTASTFVGTFKHLHARGIKPAMLYPAVNVEQFDKPHAFKWLDKRLRENVEYLEELKSLADRKVVSHKDEHFGIVPLEAMAAYKPVIACNSGGPVETIKNGMTGFLCGPSPQEFSSAMEKFIRDPQMAERMGSEARQHVVESFSTYIGQHLNQILLDIARGKDLPRLSQERTI